VTANGHVLDEAGRRVKVSKGIGNKIRSADSGVRSMLGLAGRVAIWVVIGLLLLRGAGAILAAPQSDAAPEGPRGAAVDSASSSFAVRFARTYLEDPSPGALSPFLAQGVKIGRGRAPLGRRAAVLQAEVAEARRLGGGRAVLTVACELRDARTLYLAVPISRALAGEVAVLGAPWIVAAPSVAGVAPERPRPIAGPEAPAIQDLVGRFVPAYAAARSAADLSYLVAPGATVVPLAGSLELLGNPGVAMQLGDREGSRRTVLVAGRFLDPRSGAVYPLAYRLALLRRDRWYVDAVAGALS
jgi:hypothetical protein